MSIGNSVYPMTRDKVYAPVPVREELLGETNSILQDEITRGSGKRLAIQMAGL